MYYILRGREPILVSAEKWALWFEDLNNRRVAWDEAFPGCFISTVFLGLNQRYSGNGPPILFETMAFGSDKETIDRIGAMRCCTWDEAELQHSIALIDARR